MKAQASRILGLPLMALAAMLATGVAEADAQNLFERLFGQRQRVQQPVYQAAPPPAPAPVVRAPRVSGPSYYTYKPDPLVRLDLAAMAPAAAGAAEVVSAAPGDITGSVERAPAGNGGFADALAAAANVELFAEKEIAAALSAHYAQRPAFIWVDAEGRPHARARQALRVLGEAARHGLEPADYSVSMPSVSADAERGRAELIRFEMALSARVLRYARDATGGRIDPNKISGYHDFAPKELDLSHVLDVISDSFETATYLETFHPRNAAYGALRAELEVLRAGAENDITVDPRLLLRPGDTSAELPKLMTLIRRQADEAFLEVHGGTLAENMEAETYGSRLVDVVKAVQGANGLSQDGIIGPRTVAALAGESKAGRIEKVELALEQLRWLPSDLGDRHVFLNTPSFMATYVEDGREKLSMRAIYGNTSTQTYFFQDEIAYVEFHPYWGVPRSILVNTYLPRLLRNPSYLDNAGFEVTDSRGRRVPSASVDWGRYGANIPYDVRQRPGPGNALGELKIMFPNSHAIYMHDTPDKHLFGQDNRAISNGCIRLEDPRGMAAAVLGWNVDEVGRRLTQPHSREDLSMKVPVYVAYFTAWPDDDGTVAYHHDVYDRDTRIRAALDSTGSLRAPSS